jgi:hypothetical protein
MKSHLIPEPKPIERHLSGTEAARFYLLDQALSEDVQHCKAETGRSDDFHRLPEMPMRNFLRVVFVR